MVGDILVEEHQADGCNDRTGNSQPGNRPATREHANEEQEANPNDEEGPEGSPEVEVLEDLSKQGQYAKDDQQATAYQRASITFSKHSFPRNA